MMTIVNNNVIYLQKNVSFDQRLVFTFDDLTWKQTANDNPAVEWIREHMPECFLVGFQTKVAKLANNCCILHLLVGFPQERLAQQFTLSIDYEPLIYRPPFVQIGIANRRLEWK